MNLFNPKAKHIDISVTVMIQDLINLGWDFTDIEEKDYDNTVAYIRIYGTPDSYSTTVELNNWTDHINRVANGIAEDTGNNEETILDVIALGKNVVDIQDRSTDSENEYVPGLIQDELFVITNDKYSNTPDIVTRSVLIELCRENGWDTYFSYGLDRDGNRVIMDNIGEIVAINLADSRK